MARNPLLPFWVRHLTIEQMRHLIDHLPENAFSARSRETPRPSAIGLGTTRASFLDPVPRRKQETATLEGHSQIAARPYLALADVARHLQDHFRENLDMPHLATMTGISVRHLERNFRSIFGITPREYLIRIRVVKACELLKNSPLKVSQVANGAGFYDNSDLAKHFRRQMGQSASSYRAEHRARMKQQVTE